MDRSFAFFTTGFLFAIFWASASVAGKFGLLSVEPLVLFNIRFLGAGVILLLYTLIAEKARMPKNTNGPPLHLLAHSTPHYTLAFSSSHCSTAHPELPPLP